PEQVLAEYPRALSQAYGGYYTLGRVFVKAIGRPHLMHFATKHGMSRPALMRFALKLLANLTDPHGDATDRLVNGLSKLAPNPELVAMQVVPRIGRRWQREQRRSGLR